MKVKEIVLNAFAYLLIIGGILRIFATQSTYDTLRIGYFWVENDYFIFINRIMGGLILLSGFLFISVARDLVRFKYVLGGYSLGLLVLVVIIAFSGYMLDLPFYSYIADVVFFGLIGSFCLYIRA